jgi:hypothetical protein
MKTQLLIYDPKVSDVQIIQLLKERVKAGVDVLIVGQSRPRRQARLHRQPKPARARVGQAARGGRVRQRRHDRQGDQRDV